MSVVIYDQTCHNTNKKGVQMFGTAERVSGPEELTEVAIRYIAEFPVSEKMVNSLLPAMTGLAAFYRVTLQQAKMLDTQAAIIQAGYAFIEKKRRAGIITAPAF